MPHGSGRRSWERHCTIRVVPDSAALAAFLLRAKRATYAAQGDDATVTPLIPGSKQLEYREGERLYRDVYVGLTTFPGLETGADTGAPRCAMPYAVGPAPAQRGQPPPRGLAGTRQRVVAAERGERGGDHGRGDAAGAQLHPEARGAVAARGTGGDPVAGERRVVHVAARDEIVHDLGGDVGGSAATAQPRGEIRAGPRAAGEQVARREAGGLGVEDPARRYDFSGAGALSPSVSRILASRAASTLAFS